MKKIIALMLVLCFALTMCLASCEGDKTGYDEESEKSSVDEKSESQESIDSSQEDGEYEEPNSMAEDEKSDIGFQNSQTGENQSSENNRPLEISQVINSEEGSDDREPVSMEASMDEILSDFSEDESSVPEEPSLPSDGFLNETKYWDETVNILGYNGEYSYHSIQIDTEEMTEEPLNDAFFKRNDTIKRQYGIDIELALPEMGEDPISMLRNDMISGLNEYQAIVVPIVYIAPFAVEGLLVDFNSVDNDYLHLDQPWWDQGLIQDISINDKVFFLAGDALVEDDEATWAMYFNKDLVLTYAIEEDLYQLVRNGKWTFDKMYEIAQMVNKNTFGGNKTYYNSLHIGGDQWGMVAQSYDFNLFMQGAEQTVVDNSDKVPVLRILDKENVSTFNKITEFFYDDENVGVADYHGRWDEGIYDQEKQIFAIGNALFMPGAISAIGMPVMRESQVRYGILPMPKRNELQENYSTSVTVYHCSVIAVPINNFGESLDVTCYALEAMAFYGKKLVTPEYYNRILTLKRFEDQDSADMLDLIFRNRTYDMGAIYNFHGGDYMGTLYFYTDLLGDKSTDITTLFDKRKAGFQAGLDDFISGCYSRKESN